MSFKSYKLGDIYDFSSGLSKSRSEFGFGHPFVTFKDVFYNYFIPSELSELANTTDKEREKCSVKRGDVFLTRTSETLHELGQSSVALKDYPNATFNGFTKRLRPNGKVVIHPEYIGYYFRSPNFRAEVTSMAVMTTRASLNNEIMSKLRVKLPALEEQRSIGNILKSLDDKIEVNNKINQKLEEMAQAIFKQWFIDFDFPNEEGKPYKSSGGKMVESKLGMIPKGWEIKKVGNVIDTVLGGTPSRKKIEYWEDGKISWINSGKVNEFRIIEASEYITELGLSKSSTKLLPKRTTVIAITGTTLGQVSLLEIDSCTNQSVIGLKESIELKSEFIYPWIKDKIANIVNLQTGGAQQHINKDNINKVDIIIPDKSILEQYYYITSPILNKISKVVFENNTIEKLRDTLLPKLMSGEIRVPIDK